MGTVVTGPVIDTGLDIEYEESTILNTEQIVLEYMEYWSIPLTVEILRQQMQNTIIHIGFCDSETPLQLNQGHS